MPRSDQLDLKISARPDGTVRAAYLRLADLPVARTVEVRKNALLLDVSASGVLVGIEILGPVKRESLRSVIDQRVRPARQAGVKKFVTTAVPQELVPS
jgi:hypothetical protein